MAPTASASRGRLHSNAHATGCGWIARCGANGPPSRTQTGRNALTWFATDMVFSFKKEGEHLSPLRENRVPRSGYLRAGRREGVSARALPRAKRKAPGPCELRALLRDQPSSPCTRHGRRRITWHRRTLRSTAPATFGGKAEPAT